MSGSEGNDNIASSTGINQDKMDHVGGKSKPLAVECPKVEADTDCDDLPFKATNSVQPKKEVKTSELLSLPDARETAVHSDSVNESDGSDIVEHDVSIIACATCIDISLLNEAALCLLILLFSKFH